MRTDNYGTRVFKYKLKQSFIIYAFTTPIVWLFLAYNLKTYKHKGDEWFNKTL